LPLREQPFGGSRGTAGPDTGRPDTGGPDTGYRGHGLPVSRSSGLTVSRSFPHPIGRVETGYRATGWPDDRLPVLRPHGLPVPRSFPHPIGRVETGYRATGWPDDRLPVLRPHGLPVPRSFPHPYRARRRLRAQGPRLAGVELTQVPVRPGRNFLHGFSCASEKRASFVRAKGDFVGRPYGGVCPNDTNRCRAGPPAREMACAVLDALAWATVCCHRKERG